MPVRPAPLQYRSLVRLRAVAAAAALAALSGCAYMPQAQSLQNWWPWGDKGTTHSTASATSSTTGGGRNGSPQETLAPAKERKELLVGVTAGNVLVSFNASEPGKVLTRLSLQGMNPGESFVGIDFRVAKGQLFGLSDQGRLLRIDTEKGVVSPIGSPVKLPDGEAWGVDFNPTVDRVRVVNDKGRNLRLHPDTGAQVDGDANTSGVQEDGTLMYSATDLLGGQRTRIVAAGYTYNKTNEKITTNYAIDAATGYLAIQGSIEGAATVISPNTGKLQAVGPLLIERFDDASFDIADTNNNAYLVTHRRNGSSNRFYEVNLGSGQARLIGAVGENQPLKGIAIVP
jgi:Domain of unknown function (DUF4394)